ncbi:hypothetical protein UCRPC4_g03243 [Phaeomoniella chlamydospora]|uniref:C6 transcription factor n=1 Tax=Phaeomoniella chlamydospora TaxID=158046 RepID=A0A0G2H1D6_PHACM|nr:hypothetical protein UCRPC4_g03243 [Phaeomoniella chlamydospora]
MLTSVLLPIAMSHPALCHGAIVYAAAQIANIRGDVTPSKADLQVYNRGLHSLHQSMLQQPNRFKDTLIIAAIAAAGFDLTYGRADELRRHVDGIANIIKSIGGLQYLGLGGLAAHLVLWIDFFAAIMLNRQPLYSIPSRPNITYPGPAPIYGSLVETTLSRITGGEDLSEPFTQTCRLTELLEKIARDPGPSAEVEYFTYKRNQTDHLFAVANAKYFGTGSRLSCVSLAAVTLELWILHNVGDTHSIFHHLGIEIQKALMATPLTEFWDSDLFLLQWVLFGAGSIMNDRNGSKWYQNVARQTLLQQYGSDWPINWRDLQKQNLQRLIWSELFLSLPFEAFCDKIWKLQQGEIGWK